MTDRPSVGSLLDRVKDQSVRRDRGSLSSSSSSRLRSQVPVPQESVNDPMPPPLPPRMQGHVPVARQESIIDSKMQPSLEPLNARPKIQATFPTKFKNLETGEVKDIVDFYQLRTSLENLELGDLEFLRDRMGKMLSPKPRITFVAKNAKRIIRDNFGPNAPIMENELHAFEYNNRKCFWAVIVGSIMCIVKGSRSGCRVWLGPGERFSGLKIGRPVKKPPQVSQMLKETDEEYSRGWQNKSGPQPKQVNQKGQHQGKRKARTSYSRKAQSGNTPSEVSSSDSETHESIPMKIRQERGENPEHNLESQHLGGQKSINKKETERKVKKEPFAQSPFFILSDDDSPAPDLSECSLSQEILGKTKLDISISTNDIGPVRHPLRSCQTMKALYLTGLKDCGMSHKEKEVKAMRVRFKWMPQDDEGTVLVKEAPESFDEMLKTIDSAPCWDQDGDKLCIVRVHIIMA